MRSVIFAKLDPGFYSNRKVIRAGRNGREVFLFVLCLNAQRGALGRVPAGDLEPWYLAHQLQITEADASGGLRAAVDAGLLSVEEDSVAIVGWTEDWSRRGKTDAERARDYRERRNRHGVTVTSHQQSDASPIRGDQRRSEESRSARDARGSPLEASPDLVPETWAPDEACTRLAERLQLNLAREVAQFKDWRRQRPGPSSDWDATFRTWLRRSKDAKPPTRSA